MASIINATTSSGVAVSGDTSGVLQLATNGGTTAVTIDTAQKVGIGTTTPTQKLQVNGTGRFYTGAVSTVGAVASSALLIDGAGTNGNISQIGFGYDATATYMPAAIYGLVTTQSGNTAQDIAFATRSVTTDTAPTERMRITSAGNVGIGTTSPQSQFHISRSSPGAYNAAIIENASATGYAQLLYYINGGINGIATVAYAPGIFFTLGPSSNDTTTPIVFQNNNATERMRIDTSGNVLVGRTDNPNSLTAPALYVTGVYTNTTGSAANVFVNSNGALVRSTSSLKYKTDVQDATHGLADVLKLRSVTYKGKNTETDGQTVFGGLIAEEVDAAGLTEFVQYAEDGTPDALAYGNMVSLCIKAIQEQQALITTLQTQVAELKQKVGA